MFSNLSSICCIFLCLFLFSIQSTLTLTCFNCNNCTDISSCTCDQTVDVDETYSYCLLSRETFSHGIQLEIRPFPKNITDYFIYDPYYVSVRETITYNKTDGQWFSISNFIAYACQTDNCNHADLLKELPENGLLLMLPNDWLNDTLLRKTEGAPTLCRMCTVEKVCAESPDSMNLSNICDASECQGSCLIEEKFDRPETSQFCYGSLCIPSTSIEVNEKLPRVDITAIYYLNKKQFEIVNIVVTCDGNDCSKLNLFTDIKENLQKNLSNIQAFFPLNSVHSIYSTSIILIMMILFLQISISY